MLRQTYTLAELDLTPDCYDEIATKLRDAEYHHCFMDDGTIDMHGIGVTRARAFVDDRQLDLPVAHAPILD